MLAVIFIIIMNIIVITNFNVIIIIMYKHTVEPQLGLKCHSCIIKSEPSYFDEKRANLSNVIYNYLLPDLLIAPRAY